MADICMPEYALCLLWCSICLLGILLRWECSRTRHLLRDNERLLDENRRLRPALDTARYNLRSVAHWRE